MYSLNELHTMTYLEAFDTTNTLHECPFAQRLNYVIVSRYMWLLYLLHYSI